MLMIRGDANWYFLCVSQQELKDVFEQAVIAERVHGKGKNVTLQLAVESDDVTAWGASLRKYWNAWDESALVSAPTNILVQL